MNDLTKRAKQRDTFIEDLVILTAGGVLLAWGVVGGLLL